MFMKVNFLNVHFYVGRWKWLVFVVGWRLRPQRVRHILRRHLQATAFTILNAISCLSYAVATQFLNLSSHWKSLL